MANYDIPLIGAAVVLTLLAGLFAQSNNSFDPGFISGFAQLGSAVLILCAARMFKFDRRRSY